MVLTGKKRSTGKNNAVQFGYCSDRTIERISQMVFLLFVSYLCIAQCSFTAVLNLLLPVISCICLGNEFQRNAVW